MHVHLPSTLCHDLDALLQREWLVTNGIGGFAAGTVAGPLTRRYHGLLFAALQPPLGRTLLVAKLDEIVTVGTDEHYIHTNIWQSGMTDPAGWRYLRRFDLVDGVPTWTYEIGAARLVKRIWMEHGRNATYVSYELAADSPAVQLTTRLLVNDRHYHYLEPHGQRGFSTTVEGDTIDVRADGAAITTHVRCRGATWTEEYTWYRGFHLPVEAARGFDCAEDHLAVALARVPLKPGRPVTFIMAAGKDGELDERTALQRQRARASGLVDGWARQQGQTAAEAPVPLRQLALAADQFIVARATPEEPDGHTVVAGYPWFTDWGRDTMIALPGLTLATGRFEVAKQVLRTWARHVSQGIIPNRFPDAGDRPEYHTADATLWYLWAIDQYVRATADVPTLVELFPVMKDIVAWHRRGTFHGIRVGDDGLVYAGEPGLNLTWMDAKIGDRVITPRMGKPIELSALWHDALCNMARMADLLEESDAEYVQLAETTRGSFERYWNGERHCCYDVLDGPNGAEAQLRPNQIFAVSLTHSPLSHERQVAVVDACEQHLLTWFGLRTLPADAPGYRGRYAGGPVERDEAYHQGTAWGWLLGPFVIAHYRVHKDAERAAQLLSPMLGQLWGSGMGSLSEVFDADEPHMPDGCFAQAWSVAETLRAWRVTQAGRA